MTTVRGVSCMLMLPQCVLGAPPRAGRKHRKAAAAYTLDRLQRWLEGGLQTLWDDRHQPPRSAGTRGPSAEQRRELAVALAREGFERKACNALVAKGLSSGHCCRAACLAPRSIPSVTAGKLPLSLDVVARALRSFPADTAPGPSGLRVQHLREAGPPGTALALMEQLRLWSASSLAVRPWMLSPQCWQARTWRHCANPKAA